MAVETVRQSTGGVLDVLIVNAGTSNGVWIRDGTVEDLREMVELNTIAPLRLIRAFFPLVRASSQKKVIAIGTAAGSFAIMRDFPAREP